MFVVLIDSSPKFHASICLHFWGFQPYMVYYHRPALFEASTVGKAMRGVRAHLTVSQHTGATGLGGPGIL